MFNLGLLFRVTAVVEAFYGAAGLFIPPSAVGPLLGWNLTADGQWVTKLLGLALLTQAAIAWLLRRDPPVPVAWALAAYQIGASVVDVAVWAALADEGVFANALARVSVITAIPTHFILGALLAAAAARRGAGASHA
jgi:hypothetical protein